MSNEGTVSVKQEAQKAIMQTMQMLDATVAMISKANPMAEEVPLIQEIKKTTRRMSEWAREIVKLKGIS